MRDDCFQIFLGVSASGAGPCSVFLQNGSGSPFRKPIPHVPPTARLQEPEKHGLGGLVWEVSVQVGHPSEQRSVTNSARREAILAVTWPASEAALDRGALFVGSGAPTGCQDPAAAQKQKRGPPRTAHLPITQVVFDKQSR